MVHRVGAPAIYGIVMVYQHTSDRPIRLILGPGVFVTYGSLFIWYERKYSL